MHQRRIEDLLDVSDRSLVNLMRLDLCIGSGGVLSHAPNRLQAALMMLDAFQLEGITELAVDSIFMMPQLGVMSQLHPEAARQVFDRDCLVLLGTAIATVGPARPGRPAMTVTLIRADGRTETHACLGGELRRVPLGAGETGRARVQPARSLDVGGGRGRTVERTVTGGVCGLILDARGRPLPFAADPAKNEALRARDYAGIGLNSNPLSQET
jgi:hypothetical protein